MIHTPRYLLASDFDGTHFRTSDKSPNGINVESAYTNSIYDIFGAAGARVFENIGLDGRTPSELTSAILNWGNRNQNHTDTLLNNAFSFYAKNMKGLLPYIPELSEVPQWDSEKPTKTITQLLVGQKLKYLCDEIGRVDQEGIIWPQPCRGAVEFWRTVEKLKTSGVPIDSAIISSGHDAFIRKAFAVWGLQQPDIIISEDTIRPRKYPEENVRRFKPGQLPIALAHQKWLYKHLQDKDKSFIEIARDTKHRIIYFGDDIERDQGTAIDGKLAFGLYHPSLANQPGLHFNDWHVVAEQLEQQQALFDGRPIAQILDFKVRGIEGMPIAQAQRERQQMFSLPGRKERF